MKILGERMKLLREEKELRQEDAAEILNVSMSSYCRYEYGKREPMAPTIVALARFYGVTSDYLLGLSDER